MNSTSARIGSVGAASCGAGLRHGGGLPEPDISSPWPRGLPGHRLRYGAVSWRPRRATATRVERLTWAVHWIQVQGPPVLLASERAFTCRRGPTLRKSLTSVANPLPRALHGRGRPSAVHRASPSRSRRYERHATALAPVGGLPLALRPAAAFFDLDKTIIAKSSAVASSRSFQAGGLISRHAMLRSAYAQFAYLVRGADHDQMEKTRQFISQLLRRLGRRDRPRERRRRPPQRRPDRLRRGGVADRGVPADRARHRDRLDVGVRGGRAGRRRDRRAMGRSSSERPQSDARTRTGSGSAAWGRRRADRIRGRGL